MNPRLESSKTWSSLPKELLDQINSIFSESFAAQLQGAKIKTEGRIYKEELLVRIGFIAKGRIKQTNFEASIAYNKKKENVLSLIHIAVDCLGSMFENYFKDPDTEFPKTWSPFKLENKEVFLMHSSENSDLEKKADKLLNLQDDGLVKNASNEQDFSPEQIKSKLGIKD